MHDAEKAGDLHSCRLGPKPRALCRGKPNCISARILLSTIDVEQGLVRRGGSCHVSGVSSTEADSQEMPRQ
jgi:hypothetical protein